MDEPAWSELFRFDVDEDPGSADIGYIEGVRANFSPNVDVRVGSALQNVFMPWNRRFRHFAEFVNVCKPVFRVQVWSFGTRIMLRGVLVNREAFVNSLRDHGTFPGEVYAAAVFASQFVALNLGSDFAPYPTPWVPSAPWISLSDAQRRSVAWMLHSEALVRARRSQVRFAQRIPICGSWSFDVAKCVFTRTAGGVMSLHRRGGVVADESGLGKSAAALCLVSTTRNAREKATEVPHWNDNELLETNATLFIVPPQLVQQWVGEARRYAENLRVLTLVTSKELRSSRLQDVCDADVVITTIKCLHSRIYCDLMEQLMISVLFADSASAENRIFCRNTATAGIFARRVRRNGDFSGTVVFEAFSWKRIVIDELDECFTAGRGEKLRLLQCLSANFWWGLTSSPRACEPSAYAQMFLVDEQGRPPAHHPAMSQVMLRHAIKGSRTAVGGVVVSRHTHVHSAPVQTQRASSKEDEVRETVCGNHEDHGGITFVSQQNLCLTLAHTVNEAFAQETAHSLCGPSPQQCTMCIERAVDTVLVACAHAFCRKCIIEMTRHGHRQCPVCRVSVHSTGPFAATLIGKYAPPRAISVAKLCMDVASAGERALIFSQYVTVTRYLAEVLAAHGVQAFSVDGSSVQRTTALRNFSETGSVLLLPLDSSVSGVDLVSANHVVFPHELVGDAAHVSELEKRAVSRCLRYGQSRQVNVHTFQALS